MNLMALSSVISVLLLHAVVRQHHCHAQQLDSSSSSDISFEGPDLVATLRLREGIQGKYLLQAYKSVVNDGIYKKIRNNDTSLKSALRWYSIGHPVPLFQSDETDPDKTTIVQMGHHAFYIYFSMLTDEQIGLLKARAQRKLGVHIDDEQITPLTLASFRCSFSLYDEWETQYMFKGSVKNFNTFPLQMTFPLSTGSKEDLVFRQQLPSLDHKNWPMMTCSMATKAKRVLTNALSITSRQAQQIGMQEKLFGDSSGGQQKEVYVTRDQMAEFSRDMYASLNIIEEYDMPESQFSEAFVNGLIRQTAATTFKDVPIDEALESMSKYTVDVTTDLRPDEIKSELSSILKVEEIGDKKRIVANKKKATERAKATDQSKAVSEGKTDSKSDSKSQSKSASKATAESTQTSDAQSLGEKTTEESQNAVEDSRATSKANSGSQSSDTSRVEQGAQSNAGAAASASSNSGSSSQGSKHFDSSKTSVSGGGLGFHAEASHESASGGSQHSENAFSNAQKKESSYANSEEKLAAERKKKSTSHSEASSNKQQHAEQKTRNQASDVQKSTDKKKARATNQDTSSAHSSVASKALKTAVQKAEEFAQSNQARSVDEVASLDDQLTELNKKSRNNMQWQFQGNKVIPKSINVARMTRGSFRKTLNFNRVKIQKLDADFSHTFSVSTGRLRLKVSENSLTTLADRFDQLTSRVDKLDELYEHIINDLGD